MPPQDSPLPQLINGFLSALKALPQWLRALVLFGALVVGGALAYQKYFKQEPASPTSAATSPSLSSSSSAASSSSSSQVNIVLRGLEATPPPGAPSAISVTQGGTHYTGGQPDPTNPRAKNSNPQNVEAAHQAAEYDVANAYHFQHVADESPSELSIGTDTNNDNYLHYRYFEKTDKCIWINRREGGVDHRQWIKDPLNHLHDVDDRENAVGAGLSVSPGAYGGGEYFIQKVFAALIPAASAQVLPPPKASGTCPSKLLRKSSPQPRKLPILVGSAD